MLRGMENALVNCSQFPVGLLRSQLKNNLISSEILNQIKIWPSRTQFFHELGNDKKFLQTLHTIPSIRFKHLPSSLFICCLKLLNTKSEATEYVSAQKHETQTNKRLLLSKRWRNSPTMINKKRLMPALKCSPSMGFAVLFGLIYNKGSGFWSGLALASEATFTVANVKTQGPVLGSVYGAIGCFVFERYVKIRFIFSAPMVHLQQFLGQSRIYGKAGGVSAVIGALLILGRKNYGTPSEFAIARIVETFIGLSSSIMVDILLHPTRAAVLAKLQLSRGLCLLWESICTINLHFSRGCSLEESLKMLKFHLNGLGQLIKEAEVEPNFWFSPFHSACYGKLKVSVSKMVDFLHFGSQALRFIEQESQKRWMVKFGKTLQ